MKKLLALLVFVPIIGFSQITDDFSDNNFDNNPIWLGDIDVFEITINRELHLNNNVSGSSLLYTKSKLLKNSIWKFRVKMNFNPSTQNYCRIYLASETEYFTNDKSLFLELGKNSDKIDLYYFDGTSKNLILSSVEIFTESINEIDFWLEYVDDMFTIKVKNVSDTNYIKIAEEPYIIPVFNSEYFAINPVYTKTRASKFYFDNVEVKVVEIEDITTPNIESIEIINNEEINILFTEEIIALNSNQIKINGLDLVYEISSVNNNLFKLKLSTALISGNKYTIEIENIEDLNGNILDFYEETILYYFAINNDIVINEIMFNPTPRNNLPEAEYIEFFNNTNGFIEMVDWKIEIGAKQYELPDTIIPLNSYLLFVKPEEIGQFNDAIPLNFTSLNNTSSEMRIIDNKGKEIYNIEYSSKWHSSKTKVNGGWSLELINYKNECLKKENYTSSNNIDGGTPGKENSVLDLEFYPQINNKIYAVHTNDELNEISIVLSNYINENSIIINSNLQYNFNFYTKNKGNGESEITIVIPNNSITKLTYFYFEELKSCDNLDIITDTIWLNKFSEIDINDIVINEVMYDPLENSSEFIELYNNSEKYLSLRNLYVSNFHNNEEESIADNPKKISSLNLIFVPKSFVVISKDKNSIIESYNCGDEIRFINISTMPKMSNDQGSIALLNSNLDFIDKILYTNDMHINLAKDEKRRGVSLERIKANTPSLDWNNWTSSSQNSKGATPALKNSATPLDYKIEDEISIFPKVFTPNSDGNNDVMQAVYKFNKPGFIINAKVFDANGVFVKEIANNTLASIEGSLIWDGTDENNSLKSKGIYILWIEIFDIDGNVKVFKKVVVLG